MVFYRKYRPQTIEELDSREVREKLYSILKSSSVSHAFLFTGSKGLGKTSTARIVAKVLNCENHHVILSPSASLRAKDPKNKRDSSPAQRGQNDIRDSIEPCNKCDQCVSISNSANLDVLEIDGASNRGIDEIRDIREKIKLSPMSARRKVYIIDEVHMLTQEAFNALLKTLEEPPAHAVFILCTTEPHKVPATIMSRCLSIQFKKATEEELVRSFERIMKREKLKGEKEALRLIASLSDGSFRDGVKILEEMALIAHSADSASSLQASSGQAKDKKISKELVEKNYSIASLQYRIAQMIKSLEDRDTKSGLEVVAKLVSEGVEMGHFMQGLIETLHNSLLLKAGVETIGQNSVFIIDNLKLEIPELKRLIKLLSEAKSELKYAVLSQIPLELAIVEWGLSVEGAGPDGSVPTTPVKQASSVAPLVRSALVTRPSVRKSEEVAANIQPNVTQQDIAKYSENDALWTALIDKVKAFNHSVAGVLRGCSIKSYDGKILLLQTNFKFHKDKLSESKTHEILEKAFEEVTKKNIKIMVELKSK